MKNYYEVLDDHTSTTYLATKVGLVLVGIYPDYFEVEKKWQLLKKEGVEPVSKKETLEMIRKLNEHKINSFKLTENQILPFINEDFIRKNKKEFLSDNYYSEEQNLAMFSRFLSENIQECIYRQLESLQGLKYNIDIRNKIIDIINQNCSEFNYIKEDKIDETITDIYFYYTINETSEKQYIVISIENEIIC